MKRSRTPQIFIILAAVALAGGAGATLMQYQELSDKWAKVAELKKTSRDPKEIQGELDETSVQLEKSQTELNHLEKSVPAFAYVPTMLKELEQFGKSNQIEVLGVRPIPKADSKDKKKKREAYEEIAIEVKGRGNFSSVQRFVTALQKFPKIVGVRAVSLQPKNDVNDAAAKKLDVTIELRAYLFAPTEADKAPANGAATSDPNGAPSPNQAAPAATQPATPGQAPNAAPRGNGK